MPGDSFLEQLDDKSRSALIAAGTRRSLPANAYLCLEGDPSDSLFIIESGLLRVERSTSSGRHVMLALTGPGSLFGDLGVLDGSPRSATAFTLEPTTCLAISAKNFFEVTEQHPAIMLEVARAMASRIRALTRQFVQTGERETISRVAARLVDVMDRIPAVATNGSDSVVLDMPISQEQLAQWAGLSREATARSLKSLRDRNVIVTGRRKVTILEPDALRIIAGQAE